MLGRICIRLADLLCLSEFSLVADLGGVARENPLVIRLWKSSRGQFGQLNMGVPPGGKFGPHVWGAPWWLIGAICYGSAPWWLIVAT